jgi:hypothetical protein
MGKSRRQKYPVLEAAFCLIITLVACSTPGAPCPTATVMYPTCASASGLGANASSLSQDDYVRYTDKALRTISSDFMAISRVLTGTPDKVPARGVEVLAA